MPLIRPLRTIDEHDVNPFYAYQATAGGLPVTKGTFVKIQSGWNTEQEIQELGDVGAPWQNVVSQRFGVHSRVTACTSSGDNAIGMLLYDVRETDENGQPLKFYQGKIDQMQCVLSGQAVPIVSKGYFLYSGVNGGRNPVVGVTPGAPAFLGTDGGINVSGSVTNGGVTKVGRFESAVDGNGFVLLKLDM